MPSIGPKVHQRPALQRRERGEPTITVTNQSGEAVFGVIAGLPRSRGRVGQTHRPENELQDYAKLTTIAGWVAFSTSTSCPDDRFARIIRDEFP
jgi:hypothetical protein